VSAVFVRLGRNPVYGRQIGVRHLQVVEDRNVQVGPKQLRQVQADTDVEKLLPQIHIRPVAVSGIVSGTEAHMQFKVFQVRVFDKVESLGFESAVLNPTETESRL
jgi:hypothetical protein